MLEILRYFNIHSGCSHHPWDSPLRGLRLRFAPGETVLRSGGTRPPFARDDFFHKLSEIAQ